MGLAFAVFYPLGALVMAVFRFRGVVWVHAAVQAFAYLMIVAGVGMGIWIARGEGELNAFNGHPTIGIIVFGLMTFQPFLGLAAHRSHVLESSPSSSVSSISAQKAQPAPLKATVPTHVWLGRVLIILGIINGGLGLQLSANTTKGEIAYGIIAGVLGTLYLVVGLGVWLFGRGNGEKVQNGQGQGQETKAEMRKGENVEV
ncbi:MAG: hypothetical protein M1819_006458 [Sarea resinae]|nr:MAG: hypothetical protein M1819_006458 [Sarea resinae]